MAPVRGFATLVVLVASLLPASSAEPAVEVPVLAIDDECGAGDEHCAMNALQLRGGTTATRSNVTGAIEEAREHEGAKALEEGAASDGMGNCKIGYHQTDPRSGSSIMRTGFQMRYAGNGIAGRGMYFSTSIRATQNKAHRHGFCLKVQVCLGRSKELPRWPKGCCSYGQLKAEGYDSATIERGGFYYREYVVYRDDQMHVLSGWHCNPDGSRQR
mmetsp:Transcript_28898/g.90157  ORF Transcript_28898/g.90157 Transcript_28898/m.90157 type:complete len:215 (+) Transcript_28898:46-690(+)